MKSAFTFSDMWPTDGDFMLIEQDTMVLLAAVVDTIRVVQGAIVSLYLYLPHLLIRFHMYQALSIVVCIQLFAVHLVQTVEAALVPTTVAVLVLGLDLGVDMVNLIKTCKHDVTI